MPTGLHACPGQGPITPVAVLKVLWVCLLLGCAICSLWCLCCAALNKILCAKDFCLEASWPSPLSLLKRLTPDIKKSPPTLS